MKQSLIFVGLGLGIIGIALAIYSEEPSKEVTSTEEAPTTPILEQRKQEFRDQVATIPIKNQDAKKMVLRTHTTCVTIKLVTLQKFINNLDLIVMIRAIILENLCMDILAT